MPASPAARRRPLRVDRGARAALHSARARGDRRPASDAGGRTRPAALSNESSAYYARLAPELFAEGDLDGFAEWIAAEWDDGRGTLALVAEVDGEVAGYVEAVIQQPEDWRRFFGARDFRERRLFVNAVLTAEVCRRRGIATLLVEKAEAWGRDQGASVVLLDTWAESPVSVPFWERRMGYRRRSIVFRKPL